MRDRRLDFWRGLCLVDMILVHLVWEGLDVGTILAPLVGEYTRFAAGGFVFVAGAGVGLVFLPRARENRTRRGAYADLCRRAFYVLGVHYAAVASFIALEVACGRRPATESGVSLLRNLLMLREAPPYGDILPLYVILLLTAPALLDLVRRGLWPVVALGSGALFAVGQWNPWMLSPRVPEEFPVVVWQAVFVAGLLFGTFLPRIDASSRRARVAATTAAAVVFVAVTLAARGDALGLPMTLLTLRKVPLNGGELVRYLALTTFIVLGTGLLWRVLQNRTLARLVETLGRRSLGVYVAHVWVQAVVMAIAAHLWWIGAAQALLALLALAVAVLIARTLESPSFHSAVRERVAGALRRGGALPAGVVAVLLLATALDRLSGPLPVDGDFVVGVETVDLTPAAAGEAGYDGADAQPEHSPIGGPDDLDGADPAV